MSIILLSFKRDVFVLYLMDVLFLLSSVEAL